MFRTIRNNKKRSNGRPGTMEINAANSKLNFLFILLNNQYKYRTPVLILRLSLKSWPSRECQFHRNTFHNPKNTVTGMIIR